MEYTKQEKMGTKEYKTDTLAWRTSNEVMRRVLIINAASKATAKKIAKDITTKEFIFQWGVSSKYIQTSIK